MYLFEIVHQDRIAGKLTCFDRMIFHGHLSRLSHPGGMKAFLDSQGVRLKHFGTDVKRLTEALKDHAKALAERAGRPYVYLAETHTRARGRSKEDLAREQILPSLFSHAAQAFSAEDALRFLGRKLHPALAAEVTSEARRRPEGWLVKHKMARLHQVLRQGLRAPGGDHHL